MPPGWPRPPIAAGATLGASALLARAPPVSRLQHPRQQVCPCHWSVLSSCPRDGFIPWIVPGPLPRPHGGVASARHDTTTPVLSAPRGAPFGPLARSRDGAAAPLPRLSALGGLTSLAGGAPTRPSADFCRSVRTEPSALSPAWGADRPISQGTTPNVPRLDAGCLKHPPLRMEDFAVTCPLVPGVPPLVSGSWASPRACGGGCRQTPPHGGRPGPAPHLRLREDLARGLAPRSFCAMPGTHAIELSGGEERSSLPSARTSG
jgi:hypothetical protein